ncbi:RecB-family nuclease [Sulfurisphaera ohwakuensis]|uniref:RecB-family nuclease n=1 Tax=Sulfurisphaera ohwakuensis TaxID=69656 RepID=UPI0036F37EFD
MELFIVLHNISSTQRIIDFAKLIFNLNINHFIVTKVGGVAAQAGVPEVSKLAYKNNKSFIILPDLKDAIEIFKPEVVYLFTQSAEKTFTKDLLKDKSRVMLVFPGNESGFNKLELNLGEPVKIEGLSNEISPVALVGIVAYCLINEGKILNKQ